MTGLVSSASAVICKMSDVINVWEYITFAYIQLFINLFCVNFIRHNNFNPEIIYVLGVQSFTWDDVNCWTEVKIQILMIFFFSPQGKTKNIWSTGKKLLGLEVLWPNFKSSSPLTQALQFQASQPTIPDVFALLSKNCAIN